jgi:hypothetical protein
MSDRDKRRFPVKRSHHLQHPSDEREGKIDRLGKINDFEKISASRKEAGDNDRNDFIGIEHRTLEPS